MATNSNYNGGNGQRPAGSGRRPSGNGQRPAGQRPAGSRPAGNSNGQRRVSAKQRAAKKRRKVIIFGVEIAVILIMVAVLYLVMTHTNNEGPKVTVLETEELRIPEEVQQDEAMKGYMNIALFGVDATKDSQLYKGSRSDSIMIASINMDTGDIKLVSVYRDTYLNIGTDSYQKCNAAYSYGGAEQAVKMLNMNLDMDTMKYDMSFDVNYEGKKYDLGTVYYSLADGVVVTTDTLLGAYQLAGAVEEKNDSYLFTEAFARDFKAALGQQKYITLISAEDMTGVDMEGVSMSGLQDAVFTFYEDVFKGFETGMVKKISGGYAIQADGQQVAQLMINMLDFIGKNPEQVLNATEAYMMTVMDSMNASAEDRAQIKEGFAELKASEQDFVDGASDLSAMLKEIVKEPSVSMVLNSFKYNAEVKQLAEGFRSTEVYDVTHNGKRVAKITTDSTMMSSNETVTIPKGGMTLEELQNQMARLENKYNPVVGVTVTWGWGGDNEASLEANRKEGSAVFGGNYDYTDLVVKNGRAYLPLRDICDMLGEDVGWEKTTKTSYVMQNGKRVNMNVLLQDGKSFVGVRAFEQLGYTVTYTPLEDEKMVEIMK